MSANHYIPLNGFDQQKTQFLVVITYPYTYALVQESVDMNASEVPSDH